LEQGQLVRDPWITYREKHEIDFIALAARDSKKYMNITKQF